MLENYRNESDLELVAKLLDLKTSTISLFEEQDPFHPKNILYGGISHKPDHRYGAIVLLAVNYKRIKPWIVYGTPKLHYPFSINDEGVREYNWPERWQKVEFFTKWDGTNILGYWYPTDKTCKEFCRTFKTRLTPVLKNGKWGPFVDLWQEIRATFNIESLLHITSPYNHWATQYCISYELIGEKNPHLIHYPFSLKAIPLILIIKEIFLLYKWI